MTTFRPMTIEDLDAVYDIEKRSFASPWTKTSFEQEIKESMLARYFVLESAAGDIVAFGGMWTIGDELHITNIAVTPLERSKGYGDVLVKGMIAFGLEKGFAHMTLEVRVSNQAAIRLYEKHGFVSAGVRPKYYVDSGEDALVMWKEL